VDGRTWVPDMRLLCAGGIDVTGDVGRQVAWNSMNVFQYRGKLMALFSTKNFVSGQNPGITENYVAELASDLRSFTSIPAATFLDAQPAIENTVNEPDSVMVSDGRIYAYYRINGSQGAFCVSVSEG
jgi:hypothetical protein